MNEEKKTIHLDDLLGTSDESISATEKDVETTNNTVTTYRPDVYSGKIKKSSNSKVITPKDVSINDSAKPIENISEVAKVVEKVDPEKEFMQKELDLIDEHIERTKADLEERILDPIKEKCAEIADEKALEEGASGEKYKSDSFEDLDDISDRDETPIVTDKKPVDMSSAASIELDDSDFAELDTTDFDDEEELDNHTVEDEEKRKAEEEKEKEQNKIIAEVLKPSGDEEIDISKFKIGQSAVTMNKTLKFVKAHANTLGEASVPLFTSGRKITLTALTGSELALYVADMQQESQEALKHMLGLMYKHDVSQDKPASFVAWAKSISSGDLIHINFGLYAATFGASNYISFECKQCGSFFMTENVDINDMNRINKNATAEEKERIANIRKFGKVEQNLKSLEVQYQVSGDYVVVLRPLSLFDLLEDTYINDEFRNKYGAVIRLSQFISNIYFIDRARGVLKPIDLRPEVDSIVKTLKNKILAVHKMISTLTPDQFTMLNAKLVEIDAKDIRSAEIIEYFIPEQPCLGTYKKGDHEGQKCTHIFKEQPMHPLNMLFTRHQLGVRSI